MNIEQIRDFCAAGRIAWTNHALTRMLQRGLSRGEVKSALIQGEIIEEYPDDYPHPSCLVLGYAVEGEPLHIVCGIANNEVWIITAYRPNSTEWAADYKTRKENRL